MELNVAERILLLNVLPPAEGDFLFLRAIRRLRESLSFSEAEAIELNLKRDSERITWAPGKNPVKEVEIGPVLRDYISRSIRAAAMLREEHLDFYQRFVEDDG